MSVLSKCGRADFLLWGNSLPMETRWNVSGPNWCGNTLNSDNTHTNTDTLIYTHLFSLHQGSGWVCYQRSSGLVCRVLMADLCSVWRERCLIIALIICSACQMTTTNCCDHEGCQQRHVECDLLILFGNSWMAKQNRNLSYRKVKLRSNRGTEWWVQTHFLFLENWPQQKGLEMPKCRFIQFFCTVASLIVYS